uniref:hypothetical protein n=1 Tax=Azospirillum argentinense TaxID=2970906 RepID=UPI001FFF9C42|nr:hypothetical protein [Azospirillum argentinense]
MSTLRSLSLLTFAALLLSGCYVAAGTPGPVYGYGHRSYGYGYYERPQYRYYAPPPVVYGRPYYGGYYGGIAAVPMAAPVIITGTAAGDGAAREARPSPARGRQSSLTKAQCFGPIMT